MQGKLFHPLEITFAAIIILDASFQNLEICILIYERITEIAHLSLTIQNFHYRHYYSQVLLFFVIPRTVFTRVSCLRISTNHIEKGNNNHPMTERQIFCSIQDIGLY